MIKNKNNFLLLLIVLLGFFLRFWELDKYPVSLNWDEISHGYNAYSILKTGKDEWGVTLPTIFRAFGDYKLPVYIYLTVIPIFFFGLNAFAVRFISALAGVLAIPLIYLLVNQLFSLVSFRAKRSGVEESLKERDYSTLVGMTSSRFDLTIGHLSALLLAISPWHFFISRPALEANLALTLILAGAYFLLRGLLNTKYYLLASISLSLSLHTYNTARVFVPLFLIVFFFIYRKKITHGSSTLAALLVFAASLALVLTQVLSGSGTARYQKLAILSETAVFQIGERRTQSQLTPVLARLVYNRPVYFITTFAKNYLGYFSPSFFNQSHGAQTQFAIPGQNLFTLPVLILALFGLLVSLKQLSDPSAKLILAWLALAPIASALTIDPPQALRPNPMIPAVIMLAVLGLINLPDKIKTKTSILLLFLASALFVKYLFVYLGSYQSDYSASWQYGYKEAVSVVSKYLDQYDRIIMTKRYGEPHIFYAFYGHLDPVKLQPNNDTIRFNKSDWYWTDKIGKVFFVNDWEIPITKANALHLESGGTISTNNSLLITSPDHIPANTTKIETINFRNGTPAFIIAKFN